MAITNGNGQSKAGFFTLDDISFGNIGAPAGSLDIGPSAGANKDAIGISANTSDKAYRRLTASANVTSYSKLARLHSCPRAYQLDELEANSMQMAMDIVDSGVQENIDFAFGHAVGAGIQTYAATKSLNAAILACCLAWKADFFAEKIDKYGKPKGKSLALAVLAVEKFGYFWAENMDDFEVVRLPNGKQAVELAFAVNMENGFYHFGHIDTVLVSKTTGKLVVWEGKTTGFEQVDEALYANSAQALSYSVVVDAIAKSLGDAAVATDYEVLYIVYSSTSREFQIMPFGKSRAQRAEWIQDVLLDHANLATYQKLNFYPKRGESCYHGGFRSRCKWFGTCTMHSMYDGVKPPTLSSTDEVEAVDFKATLTELVAAQRNA